MPVTDEMVAAARAEMKPFVAPNDETLRRAIGAAIDVHLLSSDIVCPLCGEGDFDAEGLSQHFLRFWCEGMKHDDV